MLEYPSIDEGLTYFWINRLANCIRMMDISKLFADGNRLGAFKMLGDTKHLEEIKSSLWKKYGFEGSE